MTMTTPQHDSDRRGGRWYGPRAWLPWAGFRSLALPWRAHTATARAMTRQEARHNVLLVLAVLLTLGTVMCAVALPALELLISVIGALLVTALVIVGCGLLPQARTAIGELRLTMEESTSPHGALHLSMMRAWLLDVLLDWQARRVEAKSSGVLREGDHDQELDARTADTPTGCGRDLGVHVYRSEDGRDTARDADHQQRRVRGLGNGQCLPREPGRLARPGFNHARGLHVQAPPALIAPAALPDDPAPERHEAEEVARG